MGAMEQNSGEGYETDSSSNKVEVAVVNTMHRAASVDDLFGPFWSLNVHANGESHHSSSSSASAVRPAPDRSSSQTRNVPCAATIDVPSTREAAQPATTHMATSSCPDSAAHGIVSGSGPAASSVQEQRGRISGGLPKSLLPTRDASVSSSATAATEASVSDLKVKANVSGEGSQQEGPSERALEAASATRGSPSARSSSQFAEVDGADVKPSFYSLEPEQFPAFVSGARGSFSTGRPYLSGRGADSTLPPSQSTSDDDQLNGTGLDERKQKRMLSNRESARRSRLRKQQHLDELRAQVAQLRAENIDMMARYGMASQRYSQITGENNVLRAHAMDLSRKLQHVHHTVAREHPNGLRALGIQPGPLDNLASDHLSPYYQPLDLELLP